MCLPWESAIAWSAKGHAVIARSAFVQLNEKDQRFYSEIINSGLGRQKHQSMVRKYSSSNRDRIGDLAVWPDKVRRDPLDLIFKRAGTHTPIALQDYVQSDSSSWHYVNAIFVDGKNAFFYSTNRKKSEQAPCDISESGELYTIWPKLLSAFQQSQDVAQQTVILAFILHMAADAYQPLHVLSAVDKNCQHDRGGNLYCVDPPLGFSKSTKKCDMNLHRLWDQGFNIFEGNLVGAEANMAHGNLAIDYLLQHSTYLTNVYPSLPKNIALDEYQKKAKETTSTLSQNAVIFLKNTLAQMAADYRASHGK